LKAEEKMLRITLVRSPIGRPAVQRRTVRALGLKKMNHSVVQRGTPEIKGMISRISHLVAVEPYEEDEKRVIE
jgi:large subunit ribosomal protein L30